MRRPPRVVVIEPRVCPGLDGDETVRSVFIGHGSTRPTEVGIERSGMLIVSVPIPSGGVCLPNLEERVGEGPPVAVKHASAHDDALTDRFPWVLASQIVIFFPDLLMAKNRSCNFRKRVRQQDKGL